MMRETQDEPRQIAVTARHDVELEANGVDVTMVVTGSSYVAGAAALRQAKEVARLVELLASVGIGETDISVENVRLQPGSGGFFASGGSASYTLRVRVEPVARLGDVLGVISAHKVCHAQRFAWRYPDEDDAVVACLVGAAAKAREGERDRHRARRAAGAGAARR